MTSLYEQNPENWDKMAAAGQTHLREMAKLFERPYEMDNALGLKSCAHHWHSGRNRASRAMENLAQYWLEKHNEKTEVALSVELKPATDTRMLLIVATPDQAAKIEKIAALIGAEVTDV